MKQRVAELDSPIGHLRIISNDAGVVATRREAVDLPQGDPHGAVAAYRAWFGGDLAALAGLPLDLHGTDFQRQVWAELRTIPPGETTTYRALAARLGKPTGASRAVGAATGANPVVIAVPCHRVLGAQGDLTGFAWGLDAKRWLLRHEGVVVPGEQLGLL